MHGGYIIDDTLVDRLIAAGRRRDADAVWDALEDHGLPVEPPFTYPPFILQLAAGLLQDRGVQLVKARGTELADAVAHVEIEVSLCSAPGEGAEARAALAAFEVDDQTLHRLVEELIGEPWEFAPAAFREAFSFFMAALDASERSARTAVVLVG